MAKTSDATKTGNLSNSSSPATKRRDTGKANAEKELETENDLAGRCSTDRLLRLAISRTGFVFDPQTGQSFTVNHTGLATLEILRKGETPAETARMLAEDFSVSYELAASSVESFLMQLWRYL